MALTGSTIASTYLKLLRANSDTMGADATASYIQDSADTDSVLSISTTRVGIGNTAPTALLTAGAITTLVTDGTTAVTPEGVNVHITEASKYAMGIKNADASGDGLIIQAGDAADDFALRVEDYDSANDLLVVQGGGNVGIGTAAPNRKLQITSSDQHLLRIHRDAASATMNINMEFAADDAGGNETVYAQVDGEIVDPTAGEEDGRLNFSTLTANSLTEKAYINESGDFNHIGNYIVNEQGRNDHVANTMSAPYYRFDGVNDGILNTPGTWPIAGYPLSLMVSFRTESTGGTALCGLYPSDENLYQIALAINEGSAGNISLRSRNESNLVEHSTSAIYNDGKWHTAVGVWVSSTQRHLYIDGVLDSTHTGTGTYHTSLDRIAVGYEADSGPGGYYEGEISKYQVYNFALSASEVKELYSGTSVPFKYKGASQTDLASGWDFTSGWATSSATVVDANTFRTNASTTGSVRYDFGTKGKRTRIRIAGTTPTGCTVQVVGVDTITIHSGDLTGTFDSTFEFLNIDTGYRIRCINTIASTKDTDITTFTITEIGAVAEYDGSGAGEKIWGDKSGNDFHGTVSGATLENTPYDSGTEYEEGTWTPAPVSYDGTAVVAEAFYTRIGRMVYFQCRVTGDGTGDTSQCIIGGLPFTVSQIGSATVGYTDSGRTSGIYPTVSTTSQRVYFYNEDGGSLTYTNLAFNSSKAIRVSGWYIN